MLISECWISWLSARRILGFLLANVVRFADWMVKDSKTGEIFRADHLVEAVLEARLKGDKEARGVKEEPKEEEDADKKKKKKKAVKSVAIKLEDGVGAEYENMLAQVGQDYPMQSLAEASRLTIIPVHNLARLCESTRSSIHLPGTR